MSTRPVRKLSAAVVAAETVVVVEIVAGTAAVVVAVEIAVGAAAVVVLAVATSVDAASIKSRDNFGTNPFG